LRRAGHDLTALVRSQDQVKTLAAVEVAAIVGDAMKPETYEAAFMAAPVIVDAWSGAGANPPAYYTTVKALLTKAAKAGQKKRYVFTAGCLDYGHNPGVLVDESFPAKMQPRGDFVRDLLASTDWEACVVRPGFVYGTTFGHYMSAWFKQGKDAKITIDGMTDKMYPYIHVFDLADAYRVIVELPDAQFAHQIYDVSDGVTRIGWKDVRLLCAKLAGLDTSEGNVVYVKDSAWPPLDASCVSTGEKLRRVGWTPRFGNMLDYLASEYKLWQTAQ